MNQILPTTLKMDIVLIGEPLSQLAKAETNWKPLKDYTIWGYSPYDSMQNIGGKIKLLPTLGSNTNLLKISTTFNGTTYLAYKPCDEFLTAHESVINSLFAMNAKRFFI